MTDEQVQRLLDEIRNAQLQIVKAIEKANKKETNEFEPCPICEGKGWVYSTGTTSATSKTCLYCNGAKTVVKSITK